MSDKDKKEDTTEHTNELRSAVLEGKVLLVKDIVSKKPQLLLQKDQDGRTPLIWAVSLGNIEAVSELLKAVKNNADLHNKFDINETDESGWTVCHIAASIGNLDMIKLIDSFGSEFDPKPDWQATTNNKQIPLHFAVSKNHYDVVKYLLDVQKVSPRAKDARQLNALHRAAANGSMPLVKLLLEAKCPVNATDRDSWTALHHAMIEGHGDVAVELIKAGADVELQDHEGFTALQVAVDDKVKAFVEAHLHEK